MSKSAALVALAIAFALVTPAYANDYISKDRDDWFRYTDGSREVTSRVELTDGGWALLGELGGLGPRWIYTESSHDWLWVYSEDTGYGEVFGDLGGAVGDAFDCHIDADNTGTFVIRKSGSQLTTPAGTFRNVTQVELDGPRSTRGVSSIWFAKGVGVVKWTEKTTGGTRTYELSAAMVGGTLYPRTTTTTTSTSGQTVAPGEWEELQGILWGCNDTYLVIDTYVDAFRATAGMRPRVLNDVSVATRGVASQLRYELAQYGVPMDDVAIKVVALDSVWLRDYGPIILRDGSGQLVVGDPDYFPDRPDDDDFPIVYARYRGWPRVHVRLDYEGGNFFSDGADVGFSSTGAITFNRGLGQSGVEREIRKLGVRRVEFFEPLIDEGTTHIDMFNKLVSPTRAIVSSYPTGHRQKRVVDDAANKMRALGYTVSRIRAEYEHDEYATYANSVLVNGVALVPQYGHASRDRNAREAYERAGFVARGVDCELLITYGGAIHCISQQVPRR